MRITVGLLLILGIAVCATDCSQLGGKNAESPTSPSPPEPGSAISYSAVGASDVIGYGSSKVCRPFEDCNGTGYVWVAARQLRAQGFTVAVDPLGLPTGVIGPTFQEVARQYGRTDIVANIIQQELPFVRRDSSLITVFSGANDVNVITGALNRGAGGTSANAFIDQMIATFRADFSTVITGLRDRAKSSRIIVLNVPNLAAMPYMAAAPLAQKQAAQSASVRMTTTVINPYPDITVIDLMCDPRVYLTSSVASDGFHPSDSGYAVLGEEIARAATSTSYPTPKTACPQMTVY
jgi:lysophospholipase L1-like esterase